MAKKINNKKIIVFSLLLVSILVIILVSILNYLDTLNFEKSVEEGEEEFKAFREEYEAQTILPRNLMELYNYKGYYDRDYFYKGLKKFLDYASYLNENVTVEQSESFYNQNSEEILDITGIEDKEEFKKLLVSIKNKNINNNNFNYAEVEIDSSYNKKGYFNFVLDVYYNNQPIKIKVAFSQQKRENKILHYEIVN